MSFMKRNLLFLFTVLCTLGIFSSCKDDDEPVLPPTVKDVLATYSNETLKAKVDGIDAATDAKVEVTQSQDKSSITINLFNIVPGVKEFAIPDAKFEAVSKAAYVSKLTGEASSDLAGYKVSVDGTVEDDILSMDIQLTEIEGDTVNVKDLYNLVYKGNMNIAVAGMPSSDPLEQRVYIVKPRTNAADSAMIKLTIKNFSFEEMNLDDISIDTILVQKRGDVLAFNATDRKLTIKNLGEVGIDLKGTIVGDEMNLDLGILAAVDAGELKVNVDFAGKSVVENKVAQIKKMTIAGDGIVESIFTTAKTTLKVWENTPAEKLLIIPTIELADKATIDSVVMFVSGEPSVALALDQPIDFSKLKTSKDYVEYFLAAEDPNIKGKHRVSVDLMKVSEFKIMMDEWASSGEPVGMTSSNGASSLLPFMGIKVPKPVARYENENVVRIMTFRTDTANQPMTLVPAITAGTMFTGKFSIVMENTLKSTQFGIPYSQQPDTLKLTYKYTPGPEFFRQVVEKVPNKKGEMVDDNVAQLVPDMTDECSINAYLYEVDSFDETLDGTNINTSTKVILKASLPSGARQDEYKTLEIPFEKVNNGTYDPAKKYKLAVVCSSSKRGDEFMGAPESTLFVKYLEVTSK